MACVLSLLALLVVVSSPFSCSAQQPSSSSEAKLLRVDEGIFELKEGRSIDITDRKILLTFVGMSGDFVAIKFNGMQNGLQNGDRFHFRQLGEMWTALWI